MQLLAAVTTLALIVVSAITFIGGIIFGSSDGEENPGTGGATASLDVGASIGENGGPLEAWWAEMEPPSYFDIDRLGLRVTQNGSSEYNPEEFAEKLAQGDAQVRPVGVGQGHTFWTEFTVANTSERERAIIRGISLKIERFEPPPGHLRVGCRGLTPASASVQEILEFQMQLSSEAVGVEQAVSNVPEPGTVLELGPDDLQAFMAGLTFSSPGEHSFRIVIHYDTSDGRSVAAVSEPHEVLLMPSAEDVEGVRSAGYDAFECRPG